MLNIILKNNMKSFYFLVLIAVNILIVNTVAAQWDVCGTGLPYGTTRVIFTNGDKVFAGTLTGVYLSSNNGSNW